MFDDSAPPSPSSALVALAPLDPEWQPILHVSNQVVLYNPTSHALSIRTDPVSSLTHQSRCPYCSRILSEDLLQTAQDARSDIDMDVEDELHTEIDDGRPRSRASNYFQLLEIANETASRPASTRTIPANGAGAGTDAGPSAFRADNMAEGYFKAFFKEEGRLGMGANGTVYLCQHMLDGNSLGHFAVKKIAVGQSHSYLLNILREVRLLERLHHPNIITYHHAWLETCQFSSFGPKVPTLHLLMQWAEGGSLDDFIDARLGRRATPHGALHTSATPFASTSSSPSPTPDTPPSAYSRSARIRAFRTLQRAPPEERERLKRELGLTGDAAGVAGAAGERKAVHLLSAEEVRGLFGDVVEGLAFLHDKSILHLDLKPGNVLLTWDEGRLIPRAMLSDFGTSQDMLKSRARSGNTGTLEYSAPESLPSPSGVLSQVDSKSDMWSLGMILHKLLFFRLPYRYASDMNEPRDGKEVLDALESEVQAYPGFKSSGPLVTAFESRRLSRAYLVLLESLLNISPLARPSSERVLGALREGRLDPLPSDPSNRPGSTSSLIPVPARRLFDASTFFSLTSSPSPDLHARVSQELDSSATGSLATTSLGEKRTSLTRIPFPSILPGTNGVWALTIPVGGRQVHVRIPRIVWLRTVKSIVLVLKVLSITRVCPNAYPLPLASAVVLGLAVMDTWFETVVSTVVLVLLHILLMRVILWGGLCNA